MMIERMATMMINDKSGRIIVNGADAWRELTGKDGWEIVMAMGDEIIKRVPDMRLQIPYAIEQGILSTEQRTLRRHKKFASHSR